MRRFSLYRYQDVSGVSGSGMVAQGVEFEDGTVVLRWLTPLKSTTIYSSMATLVQIHGHDGRTEVFWYDED